MIELDWFGCYKKRWGAEASPESHAHPAKFARNLIRQIYIYLLDEGLLKAGDTVLDPFGGVALGAADALRHGINWCGIELEMKFVDFGGCDCTGISKEDWLRCYGRWERFNYKDGRHWCPLCLAEAKETLDAPPQLSFFGQKPSASYIRNSGQFPVTLPHRYAGNIARFSKTARGGATAVLLQGDSRKLLEVLVGGWGVDAVITSAPYVESLGSDEPKKRGGLFRDPKRSGDKTLTATYGETEGQLGGHNGGTFWSAARLIVAQCRLVLKKGAPAVFVTKDFILDGQRVPFSDQWIQLCEACGFELAAHARAWLVEERGSQYNLNGDLVTKVIERKSFFRRLAERNGSPKIDWEDVLIFRAI